jgi:hypothetical protein
MAAGDEIRRQKPIYAVKPQRCGINTRQFCYLAFLAR